MLDDKTVHELKRVVSALGNEISAGAFEVLEPLSALAAAGTGVTVDMRASLVLGAPLLIVRPPHDAPRVPDGLTERQADVARLVIRGKSNKDIARALGISPATVKDHVHAILQRLKIQSRRQLMVGVASGSR